MATQSQKFYKTKAWQRVRQEVLKMDHGLCQRCLGKYIPIPNTAPKITKATVVHHALPAKQYPQYKLSIFVKQNGKRVRNLYSLCFNCHEEIEGRAHGAMLKKNKRRDDFITEERWD